MYVITRLVVSFGQNCCAVDELWTCRMQCDFKKIGYTFSQYDEGIKSTLQAGVTSALNIGESALRQL